MMAPGTGSACGIPAASAAPEPGLGVIFFPHLVGFSPGAAAGPCIPAQVDVSSRSGEAVLEVQPKEQTVGGDGGFVGPPDLPQDSRG